MTEHVSGNWQIKLKRATRYLSWLLNLEARVFSFLGAFLSALVCLLLVPVLKQSPAIRAIGSMILIGAFFLMLYRMRALTLFYRRKVRTDIVSKYSARFGPEVPLWFALCSIRSDRQNNLVSLSRNLHPLFQRALMDAGGDNESVIIGHSSIPESHQGVLSKRAFFGKVNDFFSESIAGIDKNIGHYPTAESSFGWAITGEFGHLRDWKFLRSIEKLPKGVCYHLMGRHSLAPAPLVDVLRSISALAAEEESSPNRQIGKDKQDSIENLVKRRKLLLFTYEGMLEYLHIATIGTGLFFQQAHKHGHPTLFVLIKKPSEAIVQFAKNLRDELLDSRRILPIQDDNG